MEPLNLVYSEPDTDRWIPYDRYPRKLLRKIIGRNNRVGGQKMVAVNLLKGLDKINIPYRFNNFKYINNHPKETVGIIGKPHLLYEKKWANPILFGASVFSHPIDCPDLFQKYTSVKKILVPGEWMKIMFEPYYQAKVDAWPVGIDTDLWHPSIKKNAQPIDFLIYYKIRWNHEKCDEELIDPVVEIFKKNKLNIHIIRYGFYEPHELLELVGRSKAVLFLCEHETQGLAYQQILSTGTPILAWNKRGYWVDPSYYPEKVKFQPVSSVPYWDERCGEVFASALEFEEKLNVFLDKTKNQQYAPREYILENLTLEKAAKAYLDIYQSINDIR